MAVAGLAQKDIAGFVKKCKDVQNTLPDAKRAAAGKAGMAVKTAWLGIATSQGGLTQGGKIARRKWNVGYDVKGDMGASTLVSFRGPVHLVWFPTVAHFIGAGRLGTRGTSYKKGVAGSTGRKVTGGLARKAESLNRGGGNRGAFGTLRSASRTTRSGSTLSNGKQALTIGGNLRAYAFHPATGGRSSVWPALKQVAVTTGPDIYAAEYRKALIKAGFGAGTSIAGALK